MTNVFLTKVNYTAGYTNPKVVAVVDVNGDGKPDIVTGNQNEGTVSVFLNQGDCTFGTKVDYDSGFANSDVTSIAVVDVNGDGRPDILTTNTGNRISALLNQGSGTFATKVNYDIGNLSDPCAIAVVDVNGDGKPDIVTVTSITNTASVLLNQGSGTFATKVEYGVCLHPGSVAVVDVNGDGRADIVASCDNAVSVLLNTGVGTFSTKVDYYNVVIGDGAPPLAVVDVNGDSKPDMLTSSISRSTISVCLNNGNGIFGTKVDYATGQSPGSIAIGDINEDSKPDIVTANFGLGGNHTVSVLLNQGTGTFYKNVDYTTYATPQSVQSVAVVDVNGDGKPDIITTRSVMLNMGSGSTPCSSVSYNDAYNALAASCPNDAQAAQSTLTDYFNQKKCCAIGSWITSHNCGSISNFCTVDAGCSDYPCSGSGGSTPCSSVSYNDAYNALAASCPNDAQAAQSTLTNYFNQKKCCAISSWITSHNCGSISNFCTIDAGCSDYPCSGSGSSSGSSHSSNNVGPIVGGVVGGVVGVALIGAAVAGIILYGKFHGWFGGGHNSAPYDPMSYQKMDLIAGANIPTVENTL